VISSRAASELVLIKQVCVNYLVILASAWLLFKSSLCLIMATLFNRAGHYIFALWFLLSFFSSPNLSSGQRLDAYHTCTHGVALVRI